MTKVDTRGENAGVSATGGSARSQADELRERAWKPRPRVALLIVGASFAVPVITALVMVQLAARLVRRPGDALGVIVWLAALVVLATSISWAVDRLSRRLLPLAAMLRLSLVFPDRAPSRFSVTLKTGTSKSLERALKRATTDAEFSTSAHAAALVVGLIGSVRDHDRLTRGHCERVRAYADLIGEELGLDADSRNKLHWAALLHDVGKLDVPAAILNKTEKLTPDEWQTVRGHPGASTRWIEPLRAWLGEWALAAAEHHERFDGDGYPLGLAGEEISRAGRIVAVADAFDVMTAARSYKKPLPAAQARVELANNAGTQFDPKVVRAFLAISLGQLKLVMGPLAWLSGLSGSFSAGSIVSAATTAIAALVVAATALAVPASGTTRHDARTLSASATPNYDDPSAPGFVANDAGGNGSSASSGSGSGDHTGHQSGSSRDGGGSGAGSTTDTVFATPIAGPTGPGSTKVRHSTGGGSTDGSTDGGTGGGGAPGGGGSTVTTPSTGDDGSGTTPTTAPGAVDTTPTTTPDTTPGGTPTTTPATPTTTPPPVAHAPVANPDTTGTLLTANVSIPVLANDTDADGNLDPSTLTIVTYPSSGSVTVVNGTVHVHVGALYSGTLVFTYQVCDTTGLCAQATVHAKFALSLL